MRILIGSAHFFAPDYRDAGMHRFAKTLAARGHHVDFVTFGQSQLKQLVKPEARKFARSARDAVRRGINPANIHAHIHGEWVHPLSGSKLLEALTRPVERRYGRMLDEWTSDAVQSADVVILEFGCALYYLETIKRLNPRATHVGFYSDRVSVVGFRPEIIPLIKESAPKFDLVRTNAEALLEDLPTGTNGRYVPQGIDKDQMALDLPSPYVDGTRNIVSVGNMLFDEQAVNAIAAAAPEAIVHVIGAEMETPRGNVKVYGELPFKKTLPFIVNADVGLAPYRPVIGCDYLLQSSLKIKQYSYAGLPILLNKDIGIKAPNFVTYDLNAPEGVRKAIDAAFALGKSAEYGRDLLDWDEVIDYLLTVIAETSKRTRPACS